MCTAFLFILISFLLVKIGKWSFSWPSTWKNRMRLECQKKLSEFPTQCTSGTLSVGQNKCVKMKLLLWRKLPQGSWTNKTETVAPHISNRFEYCFKPVNVLHAYSCVNNIHWWWRDESPPGRPPQSTPPRPPAPPNITMPRFGKFLMKSCLWLRTHVRTVCVCKRVCICMSACMYVYACICTFKVRHSFNAWHAKLWWIGTYMRERYAAAWIVLICYIRFCIEIILSIKNKLKISNRKMSNQTVCNESKMLMINSLIKFAVYKTAICGLRARGIITYINKAPQRKQHETYVY